MDNFDSIELHPSRRDTPRDKKVTIGTTTHSGLPKATGNHHLNNAGGGAEGIVLREEDFDEAQLGFGFSKWKKWYILTVVFMVQVSMNFNTSLYSNGLVGISEDYDVSMQAARCGAMIFLVFYAFGCELWAPWSEEVGRKPILQLSLGLVNLFQLPVALAPNLATSLIGRALGGLSTAGGSVTLGLIADMWNPDDQQYAVAYVVFSSVGGSVLGPVVGGFVQQYLPWQWNIWIQLIFGIAVQVLHLLVVPETRATIMMNKIAKDQRKKGEAVTGPTEGKKFKDMFTIKELLTTWLRPFKMLITEPIVLCLSLVSGFSDAVIFMFIQSFGIVYMHWSFNDWQIGLAFIPLLVGYFIGWGIMCLAVTFNIRERKLKPDSEKAQYESRLFWLLYTAPLLPVGLMGFAWTVQGPPLHWIGSMFFAALVGIANYAIYGSTIDYMICAYGPYSASATGGNGWARDFFAGVLTLAAEPFFTNIGSRPLEYGNTILSVISLVLVASIYVIYFKGETLRKGSKFAQELKQESQVVHERRNARIESKNNSVNNTANNSRTNSSAFHTGALV